MTHLVIATVFIILAQSPARPGAMPDRLDLAGLRAMPVQHDGRWMPLDTLARDMVNTVTGDERFDNRDPVLTLLAWTFDPQTWKDKPLIAIRHPQLRASLSLPLDKSRFSYEELMNHEPLNRAIDRLTERQGTRKPDPLESKVMEIQRKLSLLNDIFRGQVIKIIPDPQEPYGPWKPLTISHDEMHAGLSDPLKKSWVHLGRTFLDNDSDAFAQAAGDFLTKVDSLPAKFRPSPSIIQTEIRYNQGRFFQKAWIFLICAAAVSLTATIFRRKWIDGLTLLALAAGFAVLTYGLILRGRIAGHIPAANMFESLLLLSWGVAGFAILTVLVRSPRLVTLTASGIGALALVLADRLPLDHFIRPIAPVLLDTIWMSIHVPVIMVSYSVLTLAVLIAHAQLITLAAAPTRRDWSATLDKLLYAYVYAGSFLLLAGIATGSMWAASSWGRYWGWDPKEVWSLIALMGYLAILHVRLDRTKRSGWTYLLSAVLLLSLFTILIIRLAPLSIFAAVALIATSLAMIIFIFARSPFATALKSILAFWLIIMTYVGVNYVLGTGLHSYAFGTGAVTHYLFLVGTIDLSVVALCTTVYYARVSSYSH